MNRRIAGAVSLAATRAFGLWEPFDALQDDADMIDEHTTDTDTQRQTPDRRGGVVAGTVLIVAGLGLLALQWLDELGGMGILFLIGSVFLAAYFMRHVYGLLVAGSIIFGVALGLLGERLVDTGGSMNVIGIGVGFAMIYVVDRLFSPSAHWWPLIPGGILVVIGVSTIGGAFADVAAVLWPALLLVAGAFLLIGAMRRPR